MTAPFPHIRDTNGIVALVRTRGSVHYPLDALPPDFVAWRRALRSEAKRIGMRVSVLRGRDWVIVHNPDHEVSPDELAAVMDVVGSLASDVLGHGADEPPLTFEKALHDRRRARMRIVPDQD